VSDRKGQRLSDVYLHAAKSMGVKIAILTDGHSVDSSIGRVRGVGSWLESEDAINTRPLG
jgi:hypothetical protein